MWPAAVALALTLTLTGACSKDGPDALVQVPAPAATSEAVSSLCRALTQRLPESLGRGVPRRQTAERDRTAAWGKPPMTLTCGVAAPTGTPVQLMLDGLPLRTVRRSDRVVWFTTDRAVTVRLDIPLSYESQADVVIPLVPALKGLPAR